MECESKLIGRLAVSLAGRDKGTVLVIIGVCENGSVLVSDGRRRRLERPKQKKMKHLKLLECRFWKDPSEMPPQLTNRLLRDAVRTAQCEFARRNSHGEMHTAQCESSMNRMEEGSFCRRTM